MRSLGGVLKTRRGISPIYDFKLNTPALYSSKTLSILGEKLLIGGDFGKYSITTDLVFWKSYSLSNSDYFVNASCGEGPLWIIGTGDRGNHIYSGHIYTSDDEGLSFTDRGAVFNDSVTGIAYGAGVYVSVSQNGKTAYSYDGINWTLGYLLTSSLKGIIYEDGLFVVIGCYGKIYSSADGITWALRLDTGSTSHCFICIGFGNGTFVACGYYGYTYSSPDGITWTSRTSTSTSINISGIEFSSIDNLFMIFAYLKTFTSPDGITWTEVALDPKLPLYSYATAYYKDKVITAGNEGTGVCIIEGTTTYTYSGIPTTTAVQLIGGGAYGDGKFVMSTYYLTVSTSVDRFTWEKPTNVFPGGPSSYDTKMIEYIDGEFLLSGTMSSVGGNYIFRSTDGVIWTYNILPKTHAVTCLTKGGGLYLAGMTYGTELYVSNDFSTWTNVSTGILFGDYLASASYGNSTYLVGITASRVLRSTTGYTWNHVYIAGTGDYSVDSIIYENSKFIAVVGNYVSESSDDGVTWTNHLVGVRGKEIMYDSSISTYFLVTASEIYTSLNLISWTLSTLDGGPRDVSFNGATSDGNGNVIVYGNYGITYVNV